MFDNAVSRFGPGLNNVVGGNGSTNGILSDLYVPDRIGKVHEYANDFDSYNATDWTVTGAGTAALVAGDGGLLNITSAVSAFQSIQDNPAAYQLAKGFRAWFQSRVALDSLLGNIIAGILNVTATPFTGASQTDGAYFLSAVTTGALSFNVAVGGVIASVATGVSLVAASQAVLSWYYDGGVYAAAPLGRVVWEASGAGVTANARGEIAIPASGTISAFPGAVNIASVLGVNASTAVARVLTVDSLYTAKDRTNILVTPAF
jgi:hypothetical protein